MSFSDVDGWLLPLLVAVGVGAGVAVGEAVGDGSAVGVGIAVGDGSGVGGGGGTDVEVGCAVGVGVGEAVGMGPDTLKLPVAACISLWPALIAIADIPAARKRANVHIMNALAIAASLYGFISFLSAYFSWS